MPGRRLLSIQNAEESATGVGVALQDFVPPSVLAGGVSFTDSNPALGRVSGDVVVTRVACPLLWQETPQASDEQGIAGASGVAKGLVP